ncbi:hexokinase-1 [Xylariomycetidae sp. FL0641]|nr:hexokinase-1 [Xylariomycetidae sp. FL0641]
MPPFTTAMTTLTSSLLAALRNFLQGKSFLQALFAFWIRPHQLKGHGNAKDITEKMGPVRTIEEFLREAEQRLLGPIGGDRLWQFSTDLQTQFRERSRSHPECMLPSFNHLLPTGKEQGQYLALDVGGSTLRVALVELRGRDATGREREIVRMNNFKITPKVKSLRGMAFFDWVAARIHEVIHKDVSSNQDPIPMGLAWSFPVEQISLGGGLLLDMGKGFLASQDLRGQDLGEIIQVACAKQGLSVQLAAILNDSTATLLSQAYTHSETRFGLILGTGTNIAVHLPVSALGRPKYGQRADSWFKEASHVIVNTELGMFGHGILPLTRWDESLNAGHMRPDFQPLEHLLSGFYLGEICRFALAEAVETTGLFGGLMPPSLTEPYSLDTELLSRMEADTSPTLSKAHAAFTSAHPPASSPSSPAPYVYTHCDISTVQRLASLIAQRSAALLAASVYSLWNLRREAQQEYLDATPAVNGFVPLLRESEQEAAMRCTKVAFNGSVIEHYPGYRATCQRYLDALVGTDHESIVLVPALESSILGAAVALGCAVGERA